MAERANIPSSPACGLWETLLADALDGLLRPEDEATFTAHMAVCPACTALYKDARQGREWLEFLSPEPEVPAGLLDRILAQTGPGQVEGFGLLAGAAHVLPIPPVWQRPGFVGQARRYAASAHDRRHGVLHHRPHAQPDRGPIEHPAARRSAADRSPLVHGAAPDHGLHPHHPLLRPPPLCLRG